MTITDDIAAIKAALDAGPTAGPWELRVVDDLGAVAGGNGWVDAVSAGGEQELKDAAHIAACSPDRIARLVAHVERLEKALRQCHYALDRWIDSPEDAATYDDNMQRAIIAEAAARAALEGKE